MKIKNIKIPILLLFVIATLSIVEGNTIEEKLPIGDTTLILNGSGFRMAYGMRMYQCGLYLLQKSSNPDGIINEDGSMAVRMIIKSSLITGKRLQKSTREGFVNSTGGKWAQIGNQIDRFLSLVVEELKKGDVFTFIYRPQKGTEIVKNGLSRGVIEGLAFKKALFGIWLCQKPPTMELKDGMLGK